MNDEKMVLTLQLFRIPLHKTGMTYALAVADALEEKLHTNNGNFKYLLNIVNTPRYLGQKSHMNIELGTGFLYVNVLLR